MAELMYFGSGWNPAAQRRKNVAQGVSVCVRAEILPEQWNKPAGLSREAAQD